MAEKVYRIILNGKTLKTTDKAAYDREIANGAKPADAPEVAPAASDAPSKTAFTDALFPNYKSRSTMGFPITSGSPDLAPESQQEIGPVTAAVRGLGSGFTGSRLDNIEAGLRSTMPEALGGTDYKTALAESRAKNNASIDQQKLAYGGGYGVGQLLQSYALGKAGKSIGGGATKSIQMDGKTINIPTWGSKSINTGLGLAQDANTGAGMTDSDDAGEEAKGALWGLITGTGTRIGLGVGKAALGGAIKGGKKVASMYNAGRSEVDSALRPTKDFVSSLMSSRKAPSQWADPETLARDLGPKGTPPKAMPRMSKPIPKMEDYLGGDMGMDALPPIEGELTPSMRQAAYKSVGEDSPAMQQYMQGKVEENGLESILDPRKSLKNVDREAGTMAPGSDLSHTVTPAESAQARAKMIEHSKKLDTSPKYREETAKIADRKAQNTMRIGR